MKEGRKGKKGTVWRTKEKDGKEVWDIGWKKLKVWNFIREFLFKFQPEFR